MLENYVCKIYVSMTHDFSSKILEATAFGFDDGQQKKILTAAHVVTNFLEKYPSNNPQILYVIFQNHLGPVNTTPVSVEFILNDCNDHSNFEDKMPFVDSAEMVLPSGMQQPVSDFFKRRDPVANMHTFGVGYKLGQTLLSTFLGKIQRIADKHSGQHCTSRFVIKHNNRPGCSGGPYIISDGAEYYVVGSLIGEIGYESGESSPTLSVQSSANF